MTMSCAMTNYKWKMKIHPTSYLPRLRSLPVVVLTQTGRTHLETAISFLLSPLFCYFNFSDFM